MKVLVCGGRHFTDAESLNATLDELHAKKGITLLIHGGAEGADFLAYRWACKNVVPHLCVPAKWKDARGIQDNTAGPKRNSIMLKLVTPDLVIAFPGNEGTADLVKKALKAKIETWEMEC